MSDFAGDGAFVLYKAPRDEMMGKVGGKVDRREDEQKKDLELETIELKVKEAKLVIVPLIGSSRLSRVEERVMGVYKGVVIRSIKSLRVCTKSRFANAGSVATRIGSNR